MGFYWACRLYKRYTAVYLPTACRHSIPHALTLTAALARVLSSLVLLLSLAGPHTLVLTLNMGQLPLPLLVWGLITQSTKIECSTAKFNK